ncbi:MAG: hypothetical protein GWP10_07350 [Nitrospiraceae bacterium]|nr:hypothetical protein [Nitrospiraceae bacterium]
MEKVTVKCPNCGKDFEVNENATRGKCPYCKISLIFENVAESPKEKTPEKSRTAKRKVIEENVDISHIENAVDELIAERPNPKGIMDIAVIESIEIEPDESEYLSLEKKVDKILKTRG